MNRIPEDTPTPVTIFGRTYQLRGSDGSGYLDELARMVDRRMREVADSSGTADTTKVAILAALNIADECLQARRSHIDVMLEERVAPMVARIDEVLADPGCRPRVAEGGRADGTPIGEI